MCLLWFIFCYLYTVILSIKFDISLTEAPVEFIRPLKEVQVTEKESATLECEVSKPDLVAKWFLDDQEITGSDRVELVVYSTIHQLIIHSANLEDEGKYSIMVEGKKCVTTLLVDGRLLGMCLWNGMLQNFFTKDWNLCV